MHPGQVAGSIGPSSVHQLLDVACFPGDVPPDPIDLHISATCEEFWAHLEQQGVDTSALQSMQGGRPLTQTEVSKQHSVFGGGHHVEKLTATTMSEEPLSRRSSVGGGRQEPHLDRNIVKPQYEDDRKDDRVDHAAEAREASSDEWAAPSVPARKLFVRGGNALRRR